MHDIKKSHGITIFASFVIKLTKAVKKKTLAGRFAAKNQFDISM